MEDGVNETSAAERARVRFWFRVIKKKARRMAVFSSRERVSIDGSQNLSVAESDDSKCVVRCCLTSRSSVVEVDVCMYARRARFAAASKRVLRCNRVKTARKSENAKTIAIADSDRPKIYGSGCRVSREIRRFIADMSSLLRDWKRIRILCSSPVSLLKTEPEKYHW